jgi:ParB family transcriptional regulator, chromosome partitioning protein
VEREVREIHLHRISPNIRLLFDLETIENLSWEIKSFGQREPIDVWFAGDCFRIIDGEKRWRACRKLGWSRMRAVIVEAEEEG